MKSSIRECSAELILLLASVGFAAAAGTTGWCRTTAFLTYAQQHRLVLNGAQEHVIFQSVSKQTLKSKRRLLASRPKWVNRCPNR